MNVDEVAWIVRAALVASDAALAGEPVPMAVRASVQALRRATAPDAGEDTTADLTVEQVRDRLRAVSPEDLSVLLRYAQVVLTRTDPEGTSAGRYSVPAGDGVTVTWVTGHLSGVITQPGFPVEPVRLGEAQAFRPGAVDPRAMPDADAVRGDRPGAEDPRATPDDDAAMRARFVLSRRSPQRNASVLDVMERMLAGYEREVGADHILTVDTRAQLAHMYRRVGRSDEAIAAMERVVEDLRRIRGSDHPDTLEAEATVRQWREG